MWKTKHVNINEKFETIIKVLKFSPAECNDNNLIRGKELSSDWFSECKR